MSGSAQSADEKSPFPTHEESSARSPRSPPTSPTPPPTPPPRHSRLRGETPIYSTSTPLAPFPHHPPPYLSHIPGSASPKSPPPPISSPRLRPPCLPPPSPPPPPPQPGGFEGFLAILEPLSPSEHPVSEGEDNPVVVFNLDAAGLATQVSAHASCDPVAAITDLVKLIGTGLPLLFDGHEEVPPASRPWMCPSGHSPMGTTSTSG